MAVVERGVCLKDLSGDTASCLVRFYESYILRLTRSGWTAGGVDVELDKRYSFYRIVVEE